MAVRNFYIEADIDGRKTVLSGGPGSKSGGFKEIVYIRDKGSISKALYIYGWENDGKLHLTINDSEGKRIYEQHTER